jgi:protein ImuB
MYWLALHLPALPLEAVAEAFPVFHHKAGQQALATQGRSPSGILESGRLIALSKEATAAGAHIGMTLAAASSLVPGFVAVPRQLHREAELLLRLALALSGCTPSIVVEPDGLRLELSSTLRLFGGWSALMRRLEAIVRDCGVEQLRTALASTPAAASLLARVKEGSSVSHKTGKEPHSRQKPGTAELSVLTQKRLDQLPIDIALLLWSQSRTLIELLQGIGCRTLGDLRALPRGGLTRRGGRQLMNLVARAYGDEPDPQVMVEPPPAFELGLELMHRADEAASLVFAAQRLVQPLVGWLALRWLAASRLSLKLRHEKSRRCEQPDSILEIALAQPSRDAEQIMLLLRERLQRMILPAPVYAIVLRLDDAVSHAGRAGALWASHASLLENERALIDRLSARLGSDRVQRVQLCSDHRPELAMRCLSAQDPSTSVKTEHSASLPAGPSPSLNDDSAHANQAAQAKPDPAGSSRNRANTARPSPKPPAIPRPAWLLAEPMPLRDDGARPVYKGKPLVIISRAERIEAGWFDDALASRDYYVAVGDDVCCWVYRQRRGDTGAPPDSSQGVPAAPGAHERSERGGAFPRWFLHGIFG